MQKTSQSLIYQSSKATLLLCVSYFPFPTTPKLRNYNVADQRETPALRRESPARLGCAPAATGGMRSLRSWCPHPHWRVRRQGGPASWRERPTAPRKRANPRAAGRLQGQVVAAVHPGGPKSGCCKGKCCKKPENPGR